MFGWLRLLLAAAVALAHAGVAGPAGMHLGAPAVVVFYLISGYVVTAQWRMLGGMRAGLRRFYVDRALRVLPLYYLVLLLTAGFLAVSDHSSPFVVRPWDVPCWAGNLLVLPLNSFPYTGIDRCTFVPPAWSLGLEMQFYLLAPLLLARAGGRAAALWLSLGIFALAALGAVATEIHGYRLLSGTLFMFLAGGLLQDAENDPAARRQALAAWLAVAAIGLAVLAADRLSVPFNRETLLGFLAGYPLAAWLRRLPRRGWDDWLAGISYPVFLAHFLVIWAFERLAGTPPAASAASLAAYVGAVLALATLLWLGCDRPVARLRRHLRES